MEVNKIFCFLVLAQKKAKELKENIGKEVSCNEPIYKIVSDILKNLESNCNIPIEFLSVSGTQDNEVLLNLRKLNDDFSLDNAKYLSTRLSSCTDLTMKNGLFFIIKLCNEKDERKEPDNDHEFKYFGRHMILTMPQKLEINMERKISLLYLNCK